MNDQEIIDNAPNGATFYAEFVKVKLNTYAKKWGGEYRFWDERLTTWTHDGWEQSSSKANFRSLADIKRISELEKVIEKAAIAVSQAFPCLVSCDNTLIVTVPAYNKIAAEFNALKEPKS